jgi:hypothetical protein
LSLDPAVSVETNAVDLLALFQEWRQETSVDRDKNNATTTSTGEASNTTGGNQAQSLAESSKNNPVPKKVISAKRAHGFANVKRKKTAGKKLRYAGAAD